MRLRGLQPADHVPAVVEALGMHVIANRMVRPESVGRDGRPELGLAGGQLEGRGHDTDDLEAGAVDFKRSAEDVARGAEPASPQVVAEQHNALSVLLLLGGEGASYDGLHT